MSTLKDEFDEQKEKLQDKIDDALDDAQEAIQPVVKKTRRFFSRLLLWASIGLVLFAIGFLLVSNWTYSEGVRAGYLIKLSKKGYLFKTYEGQLNLGGFKDNEQGNIVGNTWEFSVTDKAIYERLQKLEGQRVNLHYKEIVRAMPWQGDTNYFVFMVEEE